MVAEQRKQPESGHEDRGVSQHKKARVDQATLPLRIMSFNVLAHKYTHFPQLVSLHGGASVEPSQARMLRIDFSTDICSDRSIDILLLQEVDHAFLLALAKKADMELYVNVAGKCLRFEQSTPPFETVGVAVGVRRLLVEAACCSTRSFPVHKNSKCWAAAQVRGVWCISVHLKGASDAPASIALVRDALQRTKAEISTERWIIGGDFNCKDDADLFLMDALPKARKVPNAKNTGLHWSFARGINIDKMWYSGVDWEQASFVRDREPLQPWDARNTWGSDHLPVYATFKVHAGGEDE